MARVTAVVNGQAQLINPFESPLENRIALQLSQWYQVTDVVVQRQYDLLSFYYNYQAKISADTKNLPSDIANVAEKMKLGCYLATGLLPSAVAVTSAGQPAPTPPAEGALDSLAKMPKAVADLIGSIATGLGVTVETAKWVLVALGLGLIAVIYWGASNPARAARLV